MELLERPKDLLQINVQSISPLDFMPLWKKQALQNTANQVFLDVRSQREFASKKLPLAVSAPLLNDQQHALIGTTYQKQGAEAAMQEGLRLSKMYLQERLALWKKLTQDKETFVTCLRGGLRSQIASHYIQYFAKHCLQIEGGYKALRQELLKELECLDSHRFYVLTGRTGSGKTKLLEQLKLPGVINLEHLACHRGSAFGSHLHLHLQAEQPSQSSFENALLFDLFCKKTHPIIVEDESRLIGHNLLPLPIKEKMKTSSVIYLEADLEVRMEHIFQEYVLCPLQEGISSHILLQNALARLKTLAKRLGLQQFQALTKLMTQAFSQVKKGQETIDKELHFKYIRILLEKYYDKRYDYAFKSHKRSVVFKGNFQECLQWLTTSLSG